MVLGSPEYMSPEQARGLEDVDHRSDIWSFCVVLYELISGHTPFAASNYNALLRSIVEDEPKPLVTRSAEEEELWQILRRGFEKTRDQRFRSMSDLGRALASWLIRQSIVEDVCGASLEAKWILRASDPTALRGARASLSSFPGLPPQSGVRATHDLATAVTVGAKPVDLTPSESALASLPPERARLRGAALILVAAGSAAVITLLVLLALRGQSEPHAGAVPAAVRPSVATPEPPKAALPPIEKEGVQPLVELRPTPVEAAPVESARPGPKASTASARRARSASPMASSSARPSSDLLSPY
jgi:serine/threonine-protein kinase